MELNFESLEMQKWNIPTNRAQRAGEQNGAICLVIKFTSRVMVIKMSKTAHFLHFFAEKQRQTVTIWGNYSSASELPLAR